VFFFRETTMWLLSASRPFPPELPYVFILFFSESCRKATLPTPPCFQGDRRYSRPFPQLRLMIGVCPSFSSLSASIPVDPFLSLLRGSLFLPCSTTLYLGPHEHLFASLCSLTRPTSGSELTEQLSSLLVFSQLLKRPAISLFSYLPPP